MAREMCEELIVCDPEYGEEVSLVIASSGHAIRTNAGAIGEPIMGGDYIRVLDEDERDRVLDPR